MIEIKASIEWVEKPTDLSVCAYCSEVIYSSMFVLCINIGDKQIETDGALCQSCYELVKENK